MPRVSSNLSQPPWNANVWQSSFSQSLKKSTWWNAWFPTSFWLLQCRIFRQHKSVGLTLRPSLSFLGKRETLTCRWPDRQPSDPLGILTTGWWCRPLFSIFGWCSSSTVALILSKPLANKILARGITAESKKAAVGNNGADCECYFQGCKCIILSVWIDSSVVDLGNNRAADKMSSHLTCEQSVGSALWETTSTFPDEAMKPHLTSNFGTELLLWHNQTTPSDEETENGWHERQALRLWLSCSWHRRSWHWHI